MTEDARHLDHCIALAEEALKAGDDPFGSVLVSADGRVLHEARNRVKTGDATQHPEFELARWAARNLAPEERPGTTVYTSGEHCPMCSAAHAWAGLGRIVYASSAKQLGEWLNEMDVPEAPITFLPIQTVAPGITVEGPVPGWDEKVRALHVRRYGDRG